MYVLISVYTREFTCVCESAWRQPRLTPRTAGVRGFAPRARPLGQCHHGTAPLRRRKAPRRKARKVRHTHTHRRRRAQRKEAQARLGSARGKRTKYKLCGGLCILVSARGVNEFRKLFSWADGCIEAVTCDFALKDDQQLAVALKMPHITMMENQ